MTDRRTPRRAPPRLIAAKRAGWCRCGEDIRVDEPIYLAPDGWRCVGCWLRETAELNRELLAEREQ